MRNVLLLALGAAAFLVTFAVERWRRRGGAESTGDPVAIAPGAGTRSREESTTGMAWIPPGTFTMGTDDASAWPDESPAHRVFVDGFWMDRHEVSNAEFGRFVEATGYVTTAERAPDVTEILRQSPPGTPPPPTESLVPGSLVFTPPSSPVALNDYSQWWKWTPGASWRHPEGPGSTIEGRGDHPVVQVSWDDAAAYARWAGKRLATEAEWERAARGGLERKRYAWGDEPPLEGSRFANLWQGHFPDSNTSEDGFARTAPVGSFAANAFGLHDMAGNVWEWCADWYDRDLYRDRVGEGVSSNPAGPDRSDDPTQPHASLRSQRGGSFLCNDAYCSRYRPSARHGCSPDTGMSHVGFRCVKSPANSPPSQ